MPLSVEDSLVFKKLTELLEDQEGIRLLLNHSRQSLEQHFTAQQKDGWSMLARHLGVSWVVADSDNDQDEDESDDHPLPKRKRRRQTKSRDKWPGFAEIQSLKFPNVYARHIQVIGCDPADFLNDSIKLVHKIAAQGSDEADAFLACFQYTCHLQSRGAKDRIRWLFSMLFYYDLTTLWQPRGCARIGDKMLEKIEDLVKDHAPESLDLKPIKTWIVIGSKLNSFCDAFGVGCPFFIEHLLTPNFFKKIFTHSGQAHDEAFRHLQNLGLCQMAEECRANELGQAIRSYTIDTFRAARLRQPAESGDSLTTPL